jgi:hypothetical protein
MQAARAALAALPADVAQQEQPSSLANAGSRKRRVVLSDSEGEGTAVVEEDAGMQSSDNEEQEAQPAPPSRLRGRRRTAAQQHDGRGSSLEEVERELTHEEECLQVPPCCSHMPECAPCYRLGMRKSTGLMLCACMQALEPTVNAAAVEEDARISVEKGETSEQLEKAEVAMQRYDLSSSGSPVSIYRLYTNAP